MEGEKYDWCPIWSHIGCIQQWFCPAENCSGSLSLHRSHRHLGMWNALCMQAHWAFKCDLIQVLCVAHSIVMFLMWNNSWNKSIHLTIVNFPVGWHILTFPLSWNLPLGKILIYLCPKHVDIIKWLCNNCVHAGFCSFINTY